MINGNPVVSRFLGFLAAAFCVVAVLSLVAYPVYKQIYASIFLTIVGIGIVYAPRLFPAQTSAGAAWFAGRTDRQWCLLILLVAVVLRLPVIAVPAQPLSDTLYYLTRAQSIAAGTGYGDYIVYPPGQSGWLAIWIYLFGFGVRSLVAVQCVLSVASVWLVWAGFRPFSRSAAMWSSAMLALSPSAVLWAGSLGHETTVLFLQGILFLLLTKAAARPSSEALLWTLFGIVNGVAMLIRPTYQIVPLLLGLTLLLTGLGMWRAISVGAATMVLTLLVVSPWTYRNYQQFQKIALVSANLGVTMLSSNHPESDGIWMETGSFGTGLDPIAKDKLQQKIAVEAIKADPVRFAVLTVKRIVFMWGGETSIPDSAYFATPGYERYRFPLRAVVQLFWVILVGCCAFGSVSLYRHGLPLHPALVLGLLLIGFLFALHAVIEPAARHHLPAEPLMAAIFLPAYGQWLLRPNCLSSTAPGQPAIPSATTGKF